MWIIKSSFILAALLTSQLGFAQFDPSGASPFKAQLSCNNVKDIQRGYLLAHILYNENSPMLETRTIERYIKWLDNAKMLFTKAEVDKITKDMTGIFKDLEARNCKKLHDIHALYLKKLNDRSAFAKKVLTKDFKLDKKTKLILDPKHREYAKSEQELQELQKKYLHFQVSNYILTDEKLPDAVEKIKKNYDRVVKKMSERKDQDIYTDYLNAFGHALDSHTSYFSADSLEDFEISMRLSLQGIGATLSSEDGYTVVESLVKGGAAQRSGLVKEKDKIIAVGQVESNGKEKPMEDVVEWDLRDVVSRIRGNKGTKVRLKILRREEGKTSTQTITLTRDEVKLEDDAASLSFVERENNGVKRKVAVINLPSFYADSRRGGRSCAKDVAKLIEDAKKQKADTLVLDVSMNGGGSLSDAVDLAGLFFGTGNVVKQSSRHPQMKAMALKDTDAAVNWNGPMVILTSRISASASEILAGALKDYNRAVVVGADHTFGKGTVQQVIPLSPGLGALKVTIGMFFTPGGFSTQHIGVSSHIVLPSEFEADEEEYGEKMLDYSLPPKQMEPFLSPTAYVTDGADKWDKVDSKMVDTLKKRSEERVSKDKEFLEIKKKIAKRKEEPKEVALEDSFKDLKERKDVNDKKKKFSDAEKKAEYLKRADINEAINVAVDIVDLKNKVPLKVIAQATTVSANDNRLIQSAKKKLEKDATLSPPGTDLQPDPSSGAILRDKKQGTL
jgi:carboxyl-terminal processing protease